MPFVVVCAKPGEENRAVGNIRSLYVPLFNPQYYDRSRRLRRPLFGRYFFVDLPRHDQDGGKMWGKVSNTRGVQYLLSNNGRPSYVPRKQIYQLRKSENENGIIDLPGRPTYAELKAECEHLGRIATFRPGQEVKIMKGPFAGSIGLYEGMTVQQRECVFLSWLGRALVPLEDLDTVDAELVTA